MNLAAAALPLSLLGLLGLCPVTYAIAAGQGGSAAPGAARLLDSAAPAPRPELCRKHPVRVASGSLNSDELLLRLLPFDRWASVSTVIDWSGTTPDAGRVPASIPRTSATSEQLLALEPDLVLLSDYNDGVVYAQLLASGVCVRHLPAPRSFEHLFRTAEWLGERLDLREQARELVEVERQRLGRIRAAAAADSKTSPRVLILQGSAASGAGTLQDDCLRKAGFRNALGEESGTPTMNTELLLALDPDFVLLGAAVTEPVFQVLERQPSPLPLELLRAAREGHLLSVPEAAQASMTFHALHLCEAQVARMRERL